MGPGRRMLEQELAAYGVTLRFHAQDVVFEVFKGLSCVETASKEAFCPSLELVGWGSMLTT